MRTAHERLAPPRRLLFAQMILASFADLGHVDGCGKAMCCFSVPAYERRMNEVRVACGPYKT
jgi:hypothetical protein